MSNPHAKTPNRQTFKHVDVGQRVILNDDYLLENHKALQLEAIALKTMENAEARATEILTAAREEAQQVLAAAQEKASQIVQSEGQAQRDAIRQQAYDEGFAAGRNEGYIQITQEAADKMRMAELIVEKAFDAETRILRQQQSQMVALLQYLLKLTLGHEIQTHPETLATLIEKAVGRIPFTGAARIRIHPETLELLKDASPEMLEAFEAMKRLVFETDSSCGPYEIYLETVTSSFDLSPESQAEIYMAHVAKQISTPEAPSVLPPVDTDAPSDTDGPPA